MERSAEERQKERKRERRDLRGGEGEIRAVLSPLTRRTI